MLIYDDFDVLIGPAFDGQHQVTVIRSSAGTGGGGRFPVSLSSVVAGAILAGPAGDDAARGRLRESPQATPPKLLRPDEKGVYLFGALFAGRVLDLFRQSAGSSGRAGNRLRVRLLFDLDDPSVARIATLPWELLYDESQRSFLVRSSDITVVRGLATRTSGAALELKPVVGPVRVLLVMADPTGTLNLKAERAGIEREFAALMTRTAASGSARREIQATFLEDATFLELTELLRTEDFHIIHFMGHGDFDAQHQGQLRFQDEWRSGQDLADVLRKEKNTRLVTLNACRTAEGLTTAGVDPFAGVAQALVMAGIPAVIAMQFPVSDRAAIVFASCLYSELGAGQPIEQAVDAGRMAILGQSAGVEWATPILFLRESVSFQGTASPEAPVAATSGPWGPAGDGAFRVFLSTTIGKLTSFRKKTHDRLLESSGVRVASPAPVPDDAQGIDVYRAALRGLLAGADLSVHILGDSPGDPYDDDPLHTYPVAQLDIALESRRPVMVIIPRDARTKIDKDPAYTAYIESLTRHYADAEQFELAFVEDKTAIADEVAAKVARLQAAKAAARDTSGAPLSAFVDAYRVDEDFAFQLEKFLSRQAIDVTRKNLVSPREFDVEIGKFPVYIVVQGHADTDWVAKRFEAAHKAAVNNRARTLVGVYYSVPGATGKRFRGVFSNPLDPLAEAEALMKQLEGGVE
jgi:CHAT domain